MTGSAGRAAMVGPYVGSVPVMLSSVNITSLSRRLVVASAATGLVLSGATGVASAQADGTTSGSLSSDSLGDTSGGSSSDGSSDNNSSDNGSSDAGSADGSSDGASSGTNPAASLAGSAAETSTEAALGSLRADGVPTLILVGAGVAAGIYFAPQIHQSLVDAGVPLPPLP